MYIVWLIFAHVPSVAWTYVSAKGPADAVGEQPFGTGRSLASATGSKSVWVGRENGRFCRVSKTPLCEMTARLVTASSRISTSNLANISSPPCSGWQPQKQSHFRLLSGYGFKDTSRSRSSWFCSLCKNFWRNPSNIAATRHVNHSLSSNGTGFCAW